MIVVADTSPISYLIRIGEIDVLPPIYGEILIPPAVYGELNDTRAPKAVLQWILTPPPWLYVRAPHLPPDEALVAADLDSG